jgi:heterodisulfide reductase subunit C
MQVRVKEHKSKFIDLRNRRSVHIALRTETHKEIKKALAERDISMQEMFQRFSELVVSMDRRAVKILDELERDKREGSLKRIQNPPIDYRSTETIYDMIAKEQVIENAQNEDGDEEDTGGI